MCVYNTHVDIEPLIEVISAKDAAASFDSNVHKLWWNIGKKLSLDVWMLKNIGANDRDSDQVKFQKVIKKKMSLKSADKSGQKLIYADLETAVNNVIKSR